jgi:RNA polymerase sigma-70 factor, ECF subfamily
VDPRRERFEGVYARYGAAVRAYARRRVVASLADDVAAEVFVVAWRRLDEMPEDPLPWLLACARRVIANLLRGERRRRTLLYRLRAVPSVTGSGTLQSAGPLAQALRCLSEGDREVLMLVAWEGLTAAQGGEVLGCSEGAFAMRLHRARRRLAVALERDGGLIESSEVV